MSDYNYAIEGNPDYAFLTVTIPANRTLKVEASSMATMDPRLIMKARLKGGLKRFLSGEDLILNEFTAPNAPASMSIGPGPAGDIAYIPVTADRPVYLASGAFLASSDTLSFEAKWEGFKKGFFSGGGFFLLRSKGAGDLWFNSYGSMIEREIDGEFVVDTGHIVAFTSGLSYEVSRIGGYKSLFFSGEGFVCRFSGKGRIWIQTRNPSRLVAWAHSYRRVESKS